MTSALEAVRSVRQYLAGRLCLEQFEDWSASFSWDIHKHGSHEAQRLAYEIRAILNAHDNDEIEGAVRAKLAAAIVPFKLEFPVDALLCPVRMSPLVGPAESLIADEQTTR